MNFDIIKQKEQQRVSSMLSTIDIHNLVLNENDINLLEKGGKAVPIGTIKERSGGRKEIKTANGWEPYKEGSKSKKQEETHEKKTSSEEESKHETNTEEEHDGGKSGQEQLSQKIQNIVEYGGTKKGKVKQLYALGLSHDQIVNYTGFSLSDVKWYAKEWDKENPGMQRGLQTQQNGQNNGNSQPTFQQTTLVPYEKLPEINVNDRWDTYELFGKMMCLGMGKSSIAYGTGGVGKTYTLMGKNQIFDQFKMTAFNEDKHDYIPGTESVQSQEDEEEGGEPRQMSSGRLLMKNEYDYVKLTGKVTASEMYKTLYENNGKIVIFDDCDEVLKDPNAVNVLKGALDTSGDGTINWKVSGKIKTDYTNILGAIREQDDKGKVNYYLPKRFKFTGQVLFISNLTHRDIPQALISRGLTIDLSMNADETAERLQQIYPHMDFQDPQGNPIEVSLEDKKAAADFISKYRYDIDMTDLNARTLGKIALIKKTVGDTGSNVDWQKMASAMLKKRK